MADHLFDDSRPPPNPLKIKYDGPAYDNGPWLSYPSRLGWPYKKEDTMADTRRLSLPAGQGAYLECWLYFGFLHAVFGDIQYKDFLYQADGKQYLTTKSLRRYIDDALKTSREKGGKDAGVFGQCSLSDFSDIKAHSDFILNSSMGRANIRPEMFFAITVLHSSLLWVFEHPTVNKNKKKTRSLVTRASVDPWASHQMRLQGWCPSEIAFFKIFSSVIPQALSLQLTRPGKEKNPEGFDVHASCTEVDCANNHVNEATYKTRHDTPDCSCEHVQFPIEKVKEILRKGKIPLVRISGSEDAPATVDIVEYRSGRDYIALSHVWADGLGNATANSLPSCQLHRLKSKASKLLWDKSSVPGSWDSPLDALQVSGRHMRLAAKSLGRSADRETFVWVDTLCVPLDDTTRKLAIRSMKTVYEKGEQDQNRYSVRYLTDIFTSPSGHGG